MGSRYRLFASAWYDDLQHTIKGLPKEDIFSMFRFQDDIRYRIPLGYKYRPDLIANRFYGNPKLYWVLIYCNRFYNSPEDFEAGTVIRVPRFERIIDIA